MHRYIPLTGIFILALVSSAPGARQDIDTTILRYVQDQTIFVAHLDLTAVDASQVDKVLVKWLDAGVIPARERQAMLAELRQGMAQFRLMSDTFQKAGGRHLILYTSVTDIPLTPGFVIAPIEQGADGRKMAEMMLGAWPARPKPVTEVMDGVVFLGTADQLQQVKAAKPADRPDVRTSLAATNGMAIRGAFAMPADVRRAIEELLPALPRELGGEPGAVYARGIRWISGGIATKDRISATAILQAADAQAAKAIADLLGKVVRLGMEEGRVPHDARQTLLKAMDDTLRVRQDQLVATAGEDDISALLKALAPSLNVARERATRVQSAANIRQMLQGIMLYASDREGAWPAKLDELINAVDLHPTVLKNPRRPDAENPYIYVKPADPRKVTPRDIVIYEAPETVTEGVNVGFGDGHVEWMTIDAFQSELQKQRKP